MVKFPVVFFFSLVLLGCSSTSVKPPVKEVPRNSEVPAKKPTLPINQSVGIFTYVSGLRHDCMYLLSTTGVELLTVGGDSPDRLQKAIAENQDSITDRLFKIREKAANFENSGVTRPAYALKSDDAFLTVMEQAALHCNTVALVTLIDSLTGNGKYSIPDTALSEIETITRYQALLAPQLKALEMTYAFEAAEYEGYDTWLSAQHRFVLLMQHIYQTLAVVAEGYLKIKEMPDKAYFHKALVTYSTLKTDAKKEVTVLSGMSLLLRLNNGGLQGSADDRKRPALQSDLNKLLNDFDEEYSLLLMELSKNTVDQHMVGSTLYPLLKVVIGHELSRTEFRKQYMQELISLIESAIKQKNSSN